MSPDQDTLRDALAGRRLRPGTAVTPLTDGLHLRGRASHVTLEGSRALPALWNLLAEALRTGDLATLEDRAPVGSAARRALGVLVAHLDEHDLLVPEADPHPHPPTPVRILARRPDAPLPRAAAEALTSHPTATPTPAYPPSTTPSRPPAPAQPPSAAPERSGVPVRLSSAAPAPADAAPGPLLAADTVAATGVPAADTPAGSVRVTVDPAAPPGQVVLETVDGRLAVAASMVGGLAVVTEPGPPDRVRADVAALTARLAAPDAPAPASRAYAVPDSPTARDGAPAAGSTLAALVGAATAHRLMRAVGGQPDPAGEGEDPRLIDGLPAVLVATTEPPRAEYRPWPAGAREVLPPPVTLADALRRLDALTDRHLGLLDAPLPGALPQLPVALVSCATPDGTLVAGGARTDLVRLDALCRAAELRLGGGPVVVGADPGHATGRALRRAALARLARLPYGLKGELISPDVWQAHPQAAHWWRTLTERLGLQACMTVRQPDPGQPLFSARVDAFDAAGRRIVARAVEATAGDAAAFAALGAGIRAVASGPVRAVPDGSCAPLAAAGEPLATWEDEGSRAGWQAALAAREPGLQHALRLLTGLTELPGTPALTGPTEPAEPAGPTGPPEPLGLTVPTGSSGPSGFSDRPGASGLAGPSVPTGPVGPSGVTAPTGSSMSAGSSGPSGLISSSGPTGAAGSAGVSALTGPSGPSGPAGATRATAPAGSAAPGTDRATAPGAAPATGAAPRTDSASDPGAAPRAGAATAPNAAPVPGAAPASAPGWATGSGGDPIGAAPAADDPGSDPPHPLVRALIACGFTVLRVTGGKP
ncbi:hypothetical protein [Streptomyces sp. NPDC090022]|uniref:hypothetical protein n=1 Tax=Streptomyces sp. NPDC090022 TaxID=3365920 RepID=UPI003828DBF8